MAPPACGRSSLIRDKDLRTWFPIEYRYVKADDIPLSMFEGRDSCSISVHQHYSMDHHNFFAAVEPIFWKYAGRPPGQAAWPQRTSCRGSIRAGRHSPRCARRWIPAGGSSMRTSLPSWA